MKEESSKVRVLVASDEKEVRRSLSDVLITWGFEVRITENGDEAYQAFSKFEPTVVLSDFQMPKMDGITLLSQLKEDGLLEHTNFIMMSAHATIDVAVEAVKNGASDFLRKPLDMVRLKLILEKLSKRADVEREMSALRDKVRKLGTFGKLNGTTPQMKNIFKQIQIIGPTAAAVLITGESGTGKQVVAKSIHNYSNRKNKPFLSVNCGATPDNLLENELFGHEENAFEGAHAQKAGFFEMANGGTLFLDEIDKMSLDLQIKVLKVLESGTLHRIGGKNELQCDVRVVAATNENLEELVDEKSFSAEFYYRLNVFNIRIPALRERDEDIPLLAQHFVEEFNLKNDRQIKGLTKKALNIIKKYSWPGNVRELKNTIERAVIVCSSDFIEDADLPETLTSKANMTPTIEFRMGQTMEEVEKHFLFHTINHMDGNKTKAAKVLGISLKTLHNRLNKYKSSI